MPETPRPTVVVNILKDQKAFDVYGGRAGLGFDGIFGNPYRIGRDGTRDEVIVKFRKYFFNRMSTDEDFKKRVIDLKGLRIGCFCTPKACHLDVIAAYLNTRTD